MKTYLFHIKGMHCKACILLTESEVTELPGVTSVKASLKHHQVEVQGEFGDKTESQIVDSLNTVLIKHGYSVSVEKTAHTIKWSDFQFAIPIAVAFIAIFILLQKLGIVNLVGGSEVSFGTAVIIGLIASVSTCMAVVGGLVLSMSASFAKEGDKIRPQVLFHIGRLLSFLILGGLIGLLGSSFQLGVTGTFILGLIVGIVLLILGLNLLDVFPSLKKLQVTLPSLMGKRVHGLKDINHTLTPILIGIATFFLPCGFTQSMQIYALSTGNFWNGALIMFFFALGTLPVLALLSFSSLSIHGKLQSGIFFKAAGLIVLFFAIFNLLNSFAAAGIIPPIFNF
jgi:sulfite exporter TauE/SafE/copper chaperone CopZ